MRLFLLLILFVSGVSASAQQSGGCDGNRYVAEVFTTVKKTTLVYAPSVSHAGAPINLSMDVYEPEGDQVSFRPVVVLEHGGSFMFGDKSNMRAYCEQLARRGYVAATIQYRLFPFFTQGFPDSIKIMDTAVKAVADMRAAIRYFREDAATNNQFKVNPNFIFVGGYSAGAVAALHHAYLDETDNIPPFMQTLLANNGGWIGNSGTASNQTFNATSQAVINMSGGLYRSYWLGVGSVPLSSIHGTADATVPYNYGLAANIAYLEGSNLIHPKAEAAGVWNYLETVTGGGHTNIYENSAYAAQLANFWAVTCTKLESMACALTDSRNPLEAKDISIFPNPVVDRQVQLVLPEGAGLVQVRIFNNLGQLAYVFRGYREGEFLDLEGLAAGVYLVQVNHGVEGMRPFAARPLVLP